MIIHTVNDLSNDSLINFLKKNLSYFAHGMINYDPEFENNPANLFAILKNGRYNTGNYFIMEENGKYMGSAGWNQYGDTALVLTRAFIPNEHRLKYYMATHLLPIIFDQTKTYHRLWITCNEYNYPIYRALDRLQHGQSAGLFNSWPEVYKKFKPIGKKVINFTEQYVAEYLRNTDAPIR
jgi:hypothetical protein